MERCFTGHPARTTAIWYYWYCNTALIYYFRIGCLEDLGGKFYSRLAASKVERTQPKVQKFIHSIKCLQQAKCNTLLIGMPHG